MRAFVAIAAAALISTSLQADDHGPIRGSWLNGNLPEDTLLYTRIPHPIGMFTSPKGSSLDPALGNDANSEAVSRIREGLANNVYPLIPVFQDMQLQAIAAHLASPIELAVVAAPAPSLVVSMAVDIDSSDEFEALFAAPGFGGVQLAAEFDDNGVAPVVGLPAPAVAHFTPGRLILNVGPSVSAESYAIVAEKIAANPDHPMRAMEQRIDESGQGLFLWANTERLIAMASLMMPPDQFQAISESGLDKTSAISMGWGVADGKGRLSILADILDNQDRGLVPLMDVDVSAKAVGEPEAVLLLGIPSVDEYSRIEAGVVAKLDEKSSAAWAEAKGKIIGEAGFEIEDFFRAIGPEVVLIFDDAGDYGAIRIRDRKQWDRLLDSVAELVGSKPTTKRIGRETYYHWSTPGTLVDFDELAEPGAGAHWAFEFLERQQDHTYWIYEDDYLYFASVPQVLIDRQAMGAKTDLGIWFEQKQRIDTSAAVLSFGGTSEKLPERVYALYLELLQMASDLAIADIDIWSMPSARQLKLPREGTIAFTVSLGNPTLATEFTFENNPVEMMGSLGGVATVGILAAIAIPAYQDYTIRAKVSEGLNLAGASKAGVVEHYFETGSFPDAAGADELSRYSGVGKYTDSVIVEPDTGIIVVNYLPDSLPDGGQIILQPYDDGFGGIRWQCSGNGIADKHLPAACRDSSASASEGR